MSCTHMHTSTQGHCSCSPTLTESGGTPSAALQDPRLELNLYKAHMQLLQETLRMYPAIGVGQLRVCATDTDVAGHLKLPAGTILWMPHHTIQNSCLNWDEPDSFIPGEV